MTFFSTPLMAQQSGRQPVPSRLPSAGSTTRQSHSTPTLSVATVRETQELLTQDLGRPPSPGEVADLVGVEQDEIINTYTADDARGTADPFNVPAQASDAPLTHQTLATTRPVTKRTAVRHLLKLLPEFDRHLLCLYFLEGRTQAEISKGLQISDQQALQLLRKAIRRFYRDMLTARLQQSTSCGSVRRSSRGEGAA